jgi:hypothetical protein
MADHAGLDGDETGPARQEAIRLDAGDTAAAEAGSAAAGELAVPRDATASALRRGKSLRDEGLCPLRTRGTDAARTNPEIVVMRH